MADEGIIREAPPYPKREEQASEPARNIAQDVFGAGPGSIEMLEDEADDTPVIEHDIDAPDAAAVAAYEEAMGKKTDAVWYVVVGVVMLFLSSFHWGVAVGGVLMVGYGGLRYAQWSSVARHAYDPWKDDDLDAWEEEEFGEA